MQGWPNHHLATPLGLGVVCLRGWSDHHPKSKLFIFYFFWPFGGGQTTPLGHGGGSATPQTSRWPSHPHGQGGGPATPISQNLFFFFFFAFWGGRTTTLALGGGSATPIQPVWGWLNHPHGLMGWSDHPYEEPPLGHGVVRPPPSLMRWPATP
jgi:hypothetical protein